MEQDKEAKDALTAAASHLQQPLNFVPPWQACWDLNMAGLAQKNIGEYAEAYQKIQQAIALTTPHLLTLQP